MRQPETIEIESVIHPNHAVLLLRVGRDAGTKNEIRSLAENKGLTRWHRYANHMLAHGTNLRYIPELLGHKSSKTTGIDTLVSQAAVQRIQRPLDKRMLSKKETSA
jgi:site-specific recombinase XerC